MTAAPAPTNSACTPACWAPVVCTECHRTKAPHGRSVALEMSGSRCDHECPGYYLPPKSPHLWNEHDSTRHYTDPEGWAAHVASCDDCRGEG